ncbi:hypothetical protein Patl1_10991 [Pistacia atlantica]|uniref:Uncharacterized protein n=1 Tax=Pistacia atlantica TaxID=434234 RepID=A0ACC1A3T4_9ROSI|nr:hypothetical protein Patl1_10991 [Pistacia atlantica]
MMLTKDTKGMAGWTGGTDVVVYELQVGAILNLSLGVIKIGAGNAKVVDATTKGAGDGEGEGRWGRVKVAWGVPEMARMANSGTPRSLEVLPCGTHKRVLTCSNPLKYEVARIAMFLQPTSVQSEYANNHVSTAMGRNNTKATRNYTSNLSTLLDSLSSKASLDSFYKDSFNGIYGLFLCRGDVSTDLCKSCVTFASQNITERCPSNRSAIIWYDQCMLHYSNKSFFGVTQSSPALLMWNTDNNNSTSPDEPNYGALGMIYTLISSAPNTEKMFGTDDTDVASGTQRGYALVQCTRDISISACQSCLGQLTDEVKKCCQDRKGWRMFNPSCSLRYEEYQFYQQLSATPTPVPAAPQPAVPNDEGKGRKNTAKIVIIIVSTLTTVAVALLGFWYYSSSCRKKRLTGA